MSAEDIEASKAPLMDHLIELRSRLIKALLGFGIAFIFCYGYTTDISYDKIGTGDTDFCLHIFFPQKFSGGKG